MSVGTHEIARGVHWLRLGGANVYFVRTGESWVMIDAGFPGSEAVIAEAAAALCRPSGAPEVILLTHGHPDHAGSAVALADSWNVPALIPEREMPYVDGTALYPEPFVSFLRRLLPGRVMETLTARSAHGEAVRPFHPEAGAPGLPEWTCVPTPGHTPGHVAFFRPADRTLITGDAVLTLAWWSRLGDRGLGWMWDLTRCRPRLTGPPTIVTCDWRAAAASIVGLSELDPWVLATGHGIPLAGSRVAPALRDFATLVRAQESP